MVQKRTISTSKEEHFSERPSRFLFALEMSKLALIVIACSMIKVAAPSLRNEILSTAVLYSCAASYLVCVGFLYLYAGLIMYEIDGDCIRVKSKLNLPSVRINVDRVIFECKLSDIERIDVISFASIPVTVIFRKKKSGVSNGTALDARFYTGPTWFLSYMPFRLGFYGLKRNGVLASRWEETRAEL